MQLKQTSIALIICSLFVSGGVLANGGHGGGPSLDVADSFNTDDSFNKTYSNSNSGDDNNTLTSNTNSADDSFNHTYTKSNDGDDGNTIHQSWSNDQDWDMDYTQTDIDTDISMNLDMNTMVATSALEGQLSNVSVMYSSGGSQGYGRKGCCGSVSVKNSNSLSGFDSASGITSVAQNVGGNALTQQSVAINAQN